MSIKRLLPSDAFKVFFVVRFSCIKHKFYILDNISGNSFYSICDRFLLFLCRVLPGTPHNTTTLLYTLVISIKNKKGVNFFTPFNNIVTFCYFLMMF